MLVAARSSSLAFVSAFASLASFASLAAISLSLAGCSAPKPGGRVCSGTGSCGADLCVVGRCRPATSSPAPPDTHRVFLEPSDVIVLSRGASSASTTSEAGPSGGARALPEAIAIGQKDGGGIVMLLRFSATWRDDSDITSAFIVLEPVEGAPLARRAATVEVARILEPWASETASIGRQPRLSLPEKAAELRPRPASPARIDVTRFVREWPRRLPDDHGIALLIDGDDALGAAFSMGITDGTGPRLEVYVR